METAQNTITAAAQSWQEIMQEKFLPFIRSNRLDLSYRPVDSWITFTDYEGFSEIQKDVLDWCARADRIGADALHEERQTREALCLREISRLTGALFERLGRECNAAQVTFAMNTCLQACRGRCSLILEGTPLSEETKKSEAQFKEFLRQMG